MWFLDDSMTLESSVHVYLLLFIRHLQRISFKTMRLADSGGSFTSLCDLHLPCFLSATVHVSLDSNVLGKMKFHNRFFSHEKSFLPLDNWWFILLVIDGVLPLYAVFGSYILSKTVIRCFFILQQLEKDVNLFGFQILTKGFEIVFPLFILLMEDSLVNFYEAVGSMIWFSFIDMDPKCLEFRDAALRRFLEKRLVWSEKEPLKRRFYNGGVISIPPRKIGRKSKSTSFYNNSDTKRLVSDCWKFRTFAGNIGFCHAVGD